jgi:lysophospholipase L1-like esterase
LVLACANEDSQEKGYDYEAVFIGDSITANWRNPEKGGHPEFFTSNNFLAMGYSGKTTASLKKLFKASVINENPRQVVILAGINDVAQNDGEYVPNEKIVENLAWMANEATKNGIRVVLCSVTPSTSFWWSKDISHPEKIIIELNKLIKALADEKGYAYADYHSALKDGSDGILSTYSNDAIHPNLAGYTVMEGIILPILQSYSAK